MEESKIIGDVRGLGFMIGVELVEDRSSKKPGTQLASKLRRRLFEKGVLMHTCGHYANVMRFMAPLVLTQRHLEIGLSIFEESVKEIEKE
jgi:4-aminobutyrate aminotransferase-like enzyme